MKKKSHKKKDTSAAKKKCFFSAAACLLLPVAFVPAPACGAYCTRRRESPSERACPAAGCCCCSSLYPLPAHRPAIAQPPPMLLACPLPTAGPCSEPFPLKMAVRPCMLQATAPLQPAPTDLFGTAADACSRARRSPWREQRPRPPRPSLRPSALAALPPLARGCSLGPTSLRDAPARLNPPRHATRPHARQIRSSGAYPLASCPLSVAYTSETCPLRCLVNLDQK